MKTRTTPRAQSNRRPPRRGAGVTHVTTIRKWGNSAAVTLPKSVTETSHLVIGTQVSVDVRPEGVVIRPTHKRQTLEELLSGVTPRNVDQLDWGKPVGKEVF